MRETCPECLKARNRCYCHLVRAVRSGPRLLLLVHPREWHHRGALNTARMVARCIPEAELLVGLDFQRDRRLAARLADPGLAPYLLYPGPESLEPQDPAVGKALAGRRPLLIVPDGTWLGARQLLRFNPNLSCLPRLALRPAGPSLMRFKRQPGEGCLCTLEAVHAALLGLQSWSPSGPPEALVAMLESLRFVVEQQVALGGEPRPATGEIR